MESNPLGLLGLLGEREQSSWKQERSLWPAASGLCVDPSTTLPFPGTGIRSTLETLNLVASEFALGELQVSSDSFLLKADKLFHLLLLLLPQTDLGR